MSGNGATYTPSTIALYSLGEDDFIVQESSVGSNSGVTPGGLALRSGGGPITGGFGDDPLHIARSTPADANNSIQIECLDRSNSYNTAIVETYDQASIDLYGIRRDTSLKAHAIVDPVNVASIVAQLALQRQLLFRNTHTFQLGWKHCLLEPMDLVQITDARLGADALTVRIIAVEEDDEGTLSISAEDFFGGYSTAILYPKQSGGGYMPNWNSNPGNVNPPVIFEPAVRASLGRSRNLGGAVRRDQLGLGAGMDFERRQLVRIGRNRQRACDLGELDGGPTTARITGHDQHPFGQFDGEPGALFSVSATDAQNLATLSWVNGELLAYQTATLTAAHEYALTTLYRGAYGSSISDHPLGAQFARLDRATARPGAFLIRRT